MTDLPIRVRGPMIRALLDGRKTQDRQVLKPWPGYQASWLSPETLHKSPRCYLREVDGRLGAQMAHPLAGQRIDGHRNEDDRPLSWVRLPYAIGDRLWVQETFTKTQYDDPVYRADARDSRGHRWSSITPGDPDNEVLWKSSTQMPRWASRITLIVTDVRVQRLHDISEDDAKAEGSEPSLSGYNYSPISGEQTPIKTFRTGFVRLWRGLHGNDAWRLDPWVVAITFTVHKGNIDQVSA